MKQSQIRSERGVETGFMDTRRYLEQVGILDRQIQNRLEDIYRLRTLACSTTVASDRERVQSSGGKDRLGAFVARIIEEEKRTDALIDKRCVIIRQIEGIGNLRFYEFLTERYVHMKSEKEMAADLCLSDRQVRRTLGNAVAAFEEKYGETYRNA